MTATYEVVVTRDSIPCASVCKTTLPKAITYISNHLPPVGMEFEIYDYDTESFVFYKLEPPVVNKRTRVKLERCKPISSALVV